MKVKVELLSPAGNFEKMKYALAYGADAVYAGIPRYSLRARENDFTTELLAGAIEYCHQSDRKIYLTLNIFPHNRKIEAVKTSLTWLAQKRPDAIIISDPGVILLAKELCPQIPVHLSTQVNTLNWVSVKFWKEIGVDRIILSRELAISEIAEIRQKVPDIELECFVHGAVCVAYSGRCLLSSYFNFRDPNQGICTNSCRWLYRLYQDQPDPPPSSPQDYQPLHGKYYLEEDERPGQFMPIDEDEHGTYIMNAKDLCAVGLLDQLAAAGVNSFKIEGRSKSVYYVSVTTRAYRRAIDNLLAGRPYDHAVEQELFSVANREYSSGFLESNPRAAGENYAESQPANCTHQYCGIVRNADPCGNLMQVSVRNRICCGEELEIITPQKNQVFKVEAIYSLDGAKVEMAHGGGRDVRIPCSNPPGEYALLRRKLQS
jgi:putative protease